VPLSNLDGYAALQIFISLKLLGQRVKVFAESGL